MKEAQGPNHLQAVNLNNEFNIFQSEKRKINLELETAG